MLNKKKSCRIWSLLLVLAMVMGLSLNAAAADNHSATVEIQWGGAELFTQTVTTQDIAKWCDGAEHLYSYDQVPADERDTLLKEYTVADALIDAYILEYGAKPDQEQVAYEWYYNAEPADHPSWGLYFSVYNGLASDAGKYYFVGSEVREGVTYYTYYWEGESWNLYIDGSKAPLYSSEYKFSECSSIVFDYNEVKSEEFETTTLIPNAEPAPGK